MEPAGQVDELLREPFGKYLSGKNFVYFYPAREVNGFTLWGRPDADDMRLLSRALDAELHPSATRHVSFVDLRRLEGADAVAFQVLTEHVASRWDEYKQRIEKQALVRPAGFSGAVVAGFYDVTPHDFPVQLFDTPDEAADWLGAGVGELLEEIDALYEAAIGAPPAVRALKELLKARLVDADLESCAKTLGLSARTLQRRLQEAETSFQGELERTRVEVAQAKLLDGEEKLTAIALEVGCASLQHFSTLFKKVTGQSPSEWRDEHQK